MATNILTSNVSSIVLKKFLPMLVNDTVSAKSVDRQIIGDGKINPSTGSRIQVKRPMQFNSIRTPDGDLSGESTDNIEVGTAFAEVQDYITVWTDWGNLEEAIQLNQLEELLAPAKDRMITELETSLTEFMKNNSAHQLGLAGTPITLWSHIAKVDAFTHEFGFPKDSNVMVQLNSFDVVNLADKQAALLNNNLTGTAWERAKITNNIGGVNYFRSNALKTHTAGAYGTGPLTLDATPTQTHDSAKDTWETTLAIAGVTATTGTIKAGDIIQVTQANRSYLQQQTKDPILGEQGNEVPYTGVVTADVTASGGGVATVIVAGPAIFETVTGGAGAFNTIKSALASGDTVEIISGAPAASSKPNLFYHKTAFGLSFVRIPRLRGGVETSSASMDGFNMRVTLFANGETNRQRIRFDMLPAFAVYNPLLAGHLYGGTTPNS